MSILRVLLVGFGFLAIVLAIALPVLLRRSERLSGFAAGTGARVIASDVGIAPAILVRDPARGLVGKPDYLLEIGERGTQRLVPLELKPRRRSRRLYESDRLQLGVYLLGLRSSFGDGAAAFGYVRYASEDFLVELTPALESKVLATAESIRSGRAAPVVHRSHNSAARCRACAVRHRCDESLAD